MPSRRGSGRLSARALILLPVLVSCAVGGRQQRVSPADQAAILAALRGSAEAWNAGDLQGHLAIYAEDVTFMTGEGVRRGATFIEEAFVRNYWSQGRPRQTLRFEQVDTRSLGMDVALQTGRFVLSGGGEPERSGWFTLVWARTPAGWRVIHDHSN